MDEMNLFSCFSPPRRLMFVGIIERNGKARDTVFAYFNAVNRAILSALHHCNMLLMRSTQVRSY